MPINQFKHYNNQDIEQYYRAQRGTPKYTHFCDIVAANPNAEYFTYKSKREEVQKKINLHFFGKDLKMKDMSRRSVNALWVTWIPIEQYEDMENLKASNTKKKVGLSHQSEYRAKNSWEDIEDKDERQKAYQEVLKKRNALYDMVKKYHTGAYTYINTKDNRKYKIRLFISSTDNLCVTQKGKTRYGYPIQLNSELLTYAKNFTPVKEKLIGPGEKIYEDMVKLKKLWTTKVHPNLWQKEVAIWKTVDLEVVQQMITEADGKHYEFWKLFHEKYNTGGELVYKTTTVASWKPKWYGDYQGYKENIARLLNGKEKFNYSWKGNYDVSVSGNMGEDGEYRAWFSLEYKGTGNGHYYLLINENLAVFAEDD